MLGVIGASFTIENSIRYVYEHTIGAATEWISSTDTAEDALARRTAREYGAFMHRTPWYEFPFGVAAGGAVARGAADRAAHAAQDRAAHGSDGRIRDQGGLRLRHPQGIGRRLRGRGPSDLRARRR